MATLSVLANHDGSVSLSVDESRSWSVYREGVLIGTFTGTTWKDRRPNVNWQRVDANDIPTAFSAGWASRADSERVFRDPNDTRHYWGEAAMATQQVGATLTYTYTGRGIGISGAVVGGNGNTPYETSCTVAVDGGTPVTIECSTSNATPNEVRELLNVVLWRAVHADVETHTVVLTVASVEASVGRVILDGLLVETGDGTVVFGQPAQYQLISGEVQTNIATVTPSMDIDAVFVDRANTMLTYQQTLSGDVFPSIIDGYAYASAYPVMMAEFFASAYLISSSQDHYDAMERQWTYAQGMKNGQGLILYLGAYLHPQYDIEYVSGCLRLWRWLGEQRFLDEALAHFDRFVSAWGYTPDSGAADWPAEYAAVYAELWSMPGAWYHNSTLATYIAVNVASAISRQRADGSIGNYISGRYSHPGQYSLFTVAQLRIVWAKYRDENGCLIPTLEADLDQVFGWESQWLYGPAAPASFYSTRYFSYGWTFIPATLGYGVDRGLVQLDPRLHNRQLSDIYSDAYWLAELEGTADPGYSSHITNSIILGIIRAKSLAESAEISTDYWQLAAEPPVVTVTAPVSPTTSGSAVLSGFVYGQGVTVTVNGNAATVVGTAWNYATALVAGVNNFTVEASNGDGSDTETVSIEYQIQATPENLPDLMVGVSGSLQDVDVFVGLSGELAAVDLFIGDGGQLVPL